MFQMAIDPLIFDESINFDALVKSRVQAAL